MKIYKYPVDVNDSMSVAMHAGAKILHVDLQLGIPCVWALVDSAAPMVSRSFAWRGTGHDCSGLSAEQHVGTVLLHSGRLVFHLFDLGEA